jgi:hypothetical protein
MSVNVCTTCDSIHGADATRAVGRFNPEGTTGYVSRSGGPERPTRDEAMADYCRTSQGEAWSYWQDDEGTWYVRVSKGAPSTLISARGLLRNVGLSRELYMHPVHCGAQDTETTMVYRQESPVEAYMREAVADYMSEGKTRHEAERLAAIDWHWESK